MIDAINMYFGGPIYDTWDKFEEYYAYTKKMGRDWVPEDIALRGVGFVNLHNLVVLKSAGIIYTPRSHSLIDKSTIDEIMAWTDNAGADLSAILPPYSLI